MVDWIRDIRLSPLGRRYKKNSRLISSERDEPKSARLPPRGLAALAG
jgi:hypothetical protein